MGCTVVKVFGGSRWCNAPLGRCRAIGAGAGANPVRAGRADPRCLRRSAERLGVTVGSQTCMRITSRMEPMAFTPRARHIQEAGADPIRGSYRRRIR